MDAKYFVWFIKIIEFYVLISYNDRYSYLYDECNK